MPDPPIPMGQAATQWYGTMMKGLVARGHHVTAWVAYRDESQRESARTLFPDDQYDFRYFALPHRPRLVSKWRSFREPYIYSYEGPLRADLRRAMSEPFDFFLPLYNWGGWLGLSHPQKTILTIHHLYSIDGFADGTRALQRISTLRAEKKLLRAYPHLVTLTDRLRAAIRRMSSSTEVSVIPLSFEASHYPPRKGREPGKPPVIGLVGTFTWGPTRSAAERLLTRLWPLLRKRRPDAHLHLVGRSVRDSLSSLLEGSGAEVYENVPDIAPHFQELDVLLYAPTNGSGMKVKVLESFAFGVPVVGNAEALEGFPARDGVEAGLAETDEALVERTLALLEQPVHWENQRRDARAMIERVCHPTVVIDQWESLFSSALARPGFANSAASTG